MPVWLILLIVFLSVFGLGCIIALWLFKWDEMDKLTEDEKEIKD